MTDYRLSLEEHDLEEFVLGNDGMISVPVDIRVPSEGKAQITCYSVVRDYIERFIKTNDPISRNGITELDGYLTETMKAFGYFPPDRKRELLLEYSIRELPKNIPNNTVILDADDINKYPSSLSKWSLESDTVCAAIVDGEIAAVAGTNDISDTAPEIYVECASRFRRRGLGRSAALGMAAHLLAAGATEVLYRHYDSNEASRRLAASAGFTFRAFLLPFVFYR